MNRRCAAGLFALLSTVAGSQSSGKTDDVAAAAPLLADYTSSRLRLP
jgi:hypothetical protein